MSLGERALTVIVGAWMGALMTWLVPLVIFIFSGDSRLTLVSAIAIVVVSVQLLQAAISWLTIRDWWREATS